MGVWSERVVPRLVDLAGRSPELDELRARACEGLHGRVLELGFGGGHNVRHYPAAVTAVLAVEPSDVGWELSRARRAAATVPVERAGLDGQQLDQEDASVDCVLTTLTLCTIPDLAAALAEVRRVLVPGGRLHFLEHGQAPDERVAAWQRRLDPVQGRLFGGCHLSRDIPSHVAEAGLEVQDVEERYLTGPAVARPWSYGFLGVARRTPDAA
jgi:ubiquinone/menaquinone biosynthesis C-methylase UbiE